MSDPEGEARPNNTELVLTFTADGFVSQGTAPDEGATP